MATLGEFADGFRSWRRILEQAGDEPIELLATFRGACAEAAMFVAKGCDQTAAIDELQDIAECYFDEEWTDQVQAALAGMIDKADELRVKATDDYRDPGYTNGQGQAQQALQILTDVEFIARFKRPDWLLEGVLLRGYLYSFTGSTGSGKTAIAMLIAAHVALGRKLGNLEVTQGRVLYLAGENPDDVRQRYIAMSQQMDFTPPIGVHFIEGVIKISQMRDVILAKMAAIGEFALVIVDTSAAYFEGDEVNSNTQLGNHARMLRTLVDLPGHPCVLVPCHPKKNAPKDDLQPLGAGAFLNEVDGNLTCSVEWPSVEVYWKGKIRGADFDRLTFELANVPHELLKTSTGKQIYTVVAKHMSETAVEEMTKAVTAGQDELLVEVHRNPKASLAELASRLGWVSGAGPNKSKVRRTLFQLKAEKLVAVKRRGGWELTEKGKIEVESELKRAETVDTKRQARD